LPDQLLLVAALGFFTRDIGIFVMMQTFGTRRGGDLGALAVLFSLYVLLPSILRGVGLASATPFFYPLPAEPVWLGVVAAWVEAVAVIVVTVGRVALREREPLPA
jgi:hypothetical protein